MCACVHCPSDGLALPSTPSYLTVSTRMEAIVSGRNTTDQQNPTRSEKINFRISKETLDRLQAEADKANRSVSLEIARRLATSFTVDAVTQSSFGGVYSYALCRLIAEALRELREQTGHGWHSDRFTFDHAVKAVNAILAYFEPAGSPDVPKDLPMIQRMRDLGLDTAAVEAQAKDFPFGTLAGTLAAFKVEVATPDSEPVYQKIKAIAGARMVGSPQADILNWEVPK